MISFIHGGTTGSPDRDPPCSPDTKPLTTRNPSKDYLTQMFISSFLLCLLCFQYNRTAAKQSASTVQEMVEAGKKLEEQWDQRGAQQYKHMEATQGSEAYSVVSAFSSSSNNGSRHALKRPLQYSTRSTDVNKGQTQRPEERKWSSQSVSKKAISESMIAHTMKDETQNIDSDLRSRKARNMHIQKLGGQLTNQARQRSKDCNGHAHNAHNAPGAPAILARRMLHYWGYANQAHLESMATRPIDGSSQPTGTADKDSLCSSDHNRQWEASTQTAPNQERHQHQPRTRLPRFYWIL